MSRSWERKVRKNSSALNKQRQKSGQKEIIVGSEQYDEFKGRNFILPSTLIFVSLLYAFLGNAVAMAQSPTLYWVTVIAYVALGIILFVRRPYLKVAKDYLSTPKWNRLRVLSAKDIKKITIQPGYILIWPEKKGANWVFSRVMNRYDTDAMGERLIKFAEQHGIAYEKLSK
ncbi:methyltransferase [Paenibacillus sp. SC116]|uniref:methyltransferase n=1 Tax=Paenibacillus sp. SC116 TaxID=2968986 RepID=UPI00215A2E49|nr:methyltransferase [Paenibacillus sp. SC116]MCR8842824.1 methyltransferase [Paenibacillus sp. SC116]